MACWGLPPPGFGPPLPQMFGPPPPQPASFGSTRYHYHTRDGGPPNDGKPPSAPSASSQMPPWGFCPAPPGPPFGAPTPPAMPCFAVGPPFSEPPLPSGYLRFPTGSAAAPGLSNFHGAIYATKDEDDGPAPGNRVNGRLAKVDDGSGVLTPEDMTTFHIFNSGLHPDRPNFKSNMKFKVQIADSQWSVKYLIKRLGGLDRNHLARPDLVAIEEWHELGNGIFRRGSTVHYESPKANYTLAEMGWGPDRGKAGRHPPVWIVLYPVRPL